MTKIINLTPHPVVLCGTTIEPQATPARCTQTAQRISEINGIPVNQKVFGEVVGLPEPQEGVVYIVSSIVASAVSGARNDVFVPDECVRDSEGRITGCNALARI